MPTGVCLHGGQRARKGDIISPIPVTEREEASNVMTLQHLDVQDGVFKDKAIGQVPGANEVMVLLESGFTMALIDDGRESSKDYER